jgi:putative tryptophan/tyrosine transport system substrate-binding protein
MNHIQSGGATAAALAAKVATSSIPIVFAIGADPVKFGLVASMNRPGGNVTGVSFLANTLVAKQLQLLQGLLPASGVIGVIVNPGNPNAVSDSTQLQSRPSGRGQDGTIRACTASGEYASFQSEITG